ncbi:fungal-specific transcription factor domain-containing protein [Aspergillus floccosus]
MSLVDGQLPRSSRSTVGDLVELLPSYEAAALLVDTYFDRVHWFMLIFHQDEFRRRWPGLYCSSSLQPHEAVRDIGFLTTFLMVIGIGLQYAGDHRRQRLSDLGIDPEGLKQRILSSIKTKLLDIVSFGTLQVVQTCILLGTYYLYHGTPRLASPVCGCGLRVAQALNLHRRMTKEQVTSGCQPEHWQMENESRKRSWWAIYEIETFSSMTYGYPHSIKDSDYDVEPLNPSAKLHGSHPPTSFKEPLTGEATLLSYKYYMSKLSVLTKEALTELYGIGGPAEVTKSMQSTNLQETIEKTTGLDARLLDWNTELPTKLQWNQPTRATTVYSSADELDRDVGATGPRFEDHIYELQALTLKLAYENARILVYRPLLSYRLVATPSRSESSAETTSPGPFHHALETCRRSALRISELIDSPIMDLVGATYAAAFVSIHTFAAGVLLAILSSMDPLSPASQEAKIGLRRLMGIQEKLRDRCVLAVQGLEILQRLTKLVMEKELNTMLDLPRTSQTSKDVHPPDDHTGSESLPAPTYTEEDLHSLGLGQENKTSHPETSQSSESGQPPYTVADDVNPDSSLRYIEDSALSEALLDFDQALLNFVPRSSFDPNEPPASRSIISDDGFPMLEQTWIWGLDNNPPLGGPFP